MLREALFFPIANHLPRLPGSDRLRSILLRLAGVRIAGRVAIWGPIILRPIGKAANLEIGPGSFINTYARFGVPVAKVSIGSNVQIGPFVCFETVSHGLRFVAGQGRGDSHAPIVVEDEVWIGAGAVILGGVTIGRGAVVAAGAVVTANVAPQTIVGGIPARTIREIGEND